MNFLVDTQLPARLAHHLTRLGHESKHTTFFEEGHLMDDEEIVHIAIKEERTIISKDSDFLDHYLLKGYPPRVLLLNFVGERGREGKEEDEQPPHPLRAPPTRHR
ncbi:MAG: DUF5615 family PIN-like protein, partial [Bacteroidota bacterium]